MRILIAAPGPLHSTFDVYKYYRDALLSLEHITVGSFSFHNIIQWQVAAINHFMPDLDEGTANTVAVSRSAREFLVDIITFDPDVIFVVSGLMIPNSVWYEVMKMRSKMINPFAIAMYFTESPYMDDSQKLLADCADIIFVNDKYSLKVFDPNDNLHVYYLPHSFNPAVHNTNVEYGYNIDEYTSDVFFCGTPFYERGKLLSEVDWTGINLKLGGNWQNAAAPEHFSILKDYALMDTTIPNTELARYYRNTQIALNIHRTRESLDESDTEISNDDAYSIGPRIYEAVACGAFVLTDKRQEAVDVFGDTIGYFNTSADLSDKIRYWLKPENALEKKEMIRAAQERIKDCTFLNRFNSIIYPVLSQVKETYLNKKG